MPTKPTSSKKSTTARANGAKSHGPATPAGRARSSQNALRHGLAVRDAALPTVSVVLDDESPADFQLLLGNEMETTVDDIHNFFADVDREPTVEDHLAYAFKLLAGGASLHLLNRYEGTIGRSYARAFKQLQLLRSLRVRPQPNEPKQSLPVEPFRRPGPIPPSKVDDKASPAPPKSLPVEPSGDRVLQTPPQRSQIHLESQQNPVPARQIPAPPSQPATMQNPTCK